MINKFTLYPIDEEAPVKDRVKKKKLKQEDLTDDHQPVPVSDPTTTNTSDIIAANSGDSPDDITSESEAKDSDSDNDDSSSSTDVDDFIFDLMAPSLEGVVHTWGGDSQGWTRPSLRSDQPQTGRV